MENLELWQAILGIVALLIGAAIGAVGGWLSATENELSRGTRVAVLKEMKDRKCPSIEDAVKDIAYLVDTQRFCEYDLRQLLKELGYQTLYLEETIRSLHYSHILAWEFRRRIFRSSTWIYFMDRPTREAYRPEFEARTKNPEPEKRDISAELQARVPDVQDQQERTYLDETMKCLSIGANRAAIIMSWNLTYHHVRRWIVMKHLAVFNNELTSRYRSKTKAHDPVSCTDDFPDGERFVLEICQAAGIFDNYRNGILVGALNKRNRCAHPSPVVVTGLR